MRINSLESFGTVDGPGVRFVVFTQGCPLRCLYCHNPDTWALDEGLKDMTPQELFEEVSKYRSYIAKGGVTLSGGEPLMQAKEAAEFFRLCHVDGLHTALDTSGVLLNDDVKELLKVTNLVLLDLKSVDEKQHKEITGGVAIDRSSKFLDYLQSEGIRCWVRHVVVPGYTDNDDLLAKLATKLEEYSVVERVELLPYHTFGTPKYDNMGLEYPLNGVDSLSKARIAEIEPLFARWNSMK